MDRRIYHIIEELPEKLDYPWTIKTMAEEVEMSVSHFQRLFKEQIGIAPMIYLKDLRLEKARELLEDETNFLQIQEIRNKVGMPHESHFTRDFKKKFGLTPTEYRKQYAEKMQAENENGKK